MGMEEETFIELVVIFPYTLLYSLLHIVPETFLEATVTIFFFDVTHEGIKTQRK